jgi:superfamily II DNA or RNA helicase
VRKVRHQDAYRYISAKLFAGLSSFAELENRISNLHTPQERGAAFEVFAEAYLSTQRVPQAMEVWPIGTEPLDIRSTLVLPASDKGIDGLILAEDGEFTAYQVKFRHDRKAIVWDDLGNFFGLSDRVQRRLVFTNASDVNDTASARAGFMAVRGGDLDELTASDFDNIEAWFDGLEAVRQIATPDPHQSEAVDAIASTFAGADRALALMACGSGKTLVALWTAERLNARTVLILLPSLALVRQTLHQWLKNTSLPRGGVSFICVCSDATVSREMDEIHVRTGDLDFPVTTDAGILKTYLSQPYAGVKLVFSTYQSTKVVMDATKGLPSFDLGIFDEAHKTAGRDGVRTALALDDANVAIKKRLFMTATPRHYNISKRDKEGDAKLVFSMDMPETYGPVAYSLPFTEAVRRDIICNYRIVISVVTSEMLNDARLRRGVVIVDGDEVKARQVANQIALAAAVEKYPIKKIFTFHTSVASAKSFVAPGAEGISNHLPNFQAYHVNGDMLTSDREKTMKSFRDAPLATISNARCLTEGVDVPAVDLVAFMSPKRSLVDIVQATGRAMRKLKGKKRGYILVPLYVEVARGESVADAVRRSDFSDVWLVIHRMKEVDAMLAQEITTLRQERGRTAGFDDSRLREIIDILGPQISLEEIRQSIVAKCIDAVGDVWDERYGELVAYREKHGNCDIEARNEENAPLAKWVVTQRVERRARRLSIDRIALLDKIGFNWDPRKAGWRERYMELVEYKKLHDDCNVPQNRSKYRVLAGWLKKQRAEYREGLLAQERVDLLENLGIIWDRSPQTWEDRYQELLEYHRINKHSHVPVRWPENKTLAEWVCKQRAMHRKGAISPERKLLLDKIDFPWTVVKTKDEVWNSRLNELRRYFEKYGTCKFKKGREHSAGLPGWVTEQRLALKRNLLSDSQREKLRALRIWDEDVPVGGNWDKMLMLLRDYQKTHQNCLVPSGWKENRPLASWVTNQRLARREGQLSLERIAQLDSIGFIWEPRVVQWWERYSEARKYFDENGHCSVPYRHPLEKWVFYQSKALRKGSLSNEQVEALEVIGLATIFPSEQWDKFFPFLKDYFRLQGNLNVPFEWEHCPGLGKWLHGIRVEKKAGRLTSDQILELEALAIDWNAGDPEWEMRIRELTEYKNAHGKCSAITGNPVLAAWVSRIKRELADGLLNELQIQEIDELGLLPEPRKGRNWNEMYERLKAFFDQRGHSSVPYGYKADPPLARWVSTQRANERKGRIEPAKRELLDKLKFDWLPNENHWQRRMDELTRFFREFNHFDVPDEGRYRALAKWTGYIRNRKESGLLEEDRTRELDELGFTWTSDREPVWEAWFARLIEFKSRNGHTLVSMSQPEDAPLARWVQTQRIAKRQGKLDSERIRRLSEIDFEWQPHDAKWSAQFEKLIAYHSTNGFWEAGYESEEATKLARWIEKQRNSYRQGSLSPERMTALNRIGFPWTPDRVRWEQQYARLSAYLAHNGAFPKNGKATEEQSLIRWMAAQRRSRLEGMMSAADESKLNALGFVWHEVQIDWTKMIEMARAYFELNGNLKVPRNGDSRELSDWLSKQRTAYRQGLLSSERQKALENFGMNWDMTPIAWEERFEELKAYRNRFGDCNVPYEWPENIEMARWFGKQQTAYRRGELEESKLRKLEDLGVSWKSRRDKWDMRFEELVRFKERSGHVVPSYFKAETKQLSLWCTSQRKAEKEGRLPADRIAKLSSLGFTWDSQRIRGDEYWEQQFQALVEYKTKNGTCKVPVGWRDKDHPNKHEYKLSNWCYVQNRTLKEGKMKPERFERLSMIGFPWKG